MIIETFYFETDEFQQPDCGPWRASAEKHGRQSALTEDGLEGAQGAAIRKPYFGECRRKSMRQQTSMPQSSTACRLRTTAKKGCGSVPTFVTGGEKSALGGVYKESAGENTVL